MNNSFSFNFDERDENRDTVQDISIRFDCGNDFDEVLAKRLNTFLNAVGSQLTIKVKQ
jgi:hypothetical protein